MSLLRENKVVFSGVLGARNATGNNDHRCATLSTEEMQADEKHKCRLNFIFKFLLISFIFIVPFCTQLMALNCGGLILIRKRKWIAQKSFTNNFRLVLSKFLYFFVAWLISVLLEIPKNDVGHFTPKNALL